MKKENIEDKIVAGILAGDEKVLRQFYEKHFPSVSNFIRMRGGSYEESQDIYQDAFIFVYKKLREESLTLTSSLGTYLIGVCKGMWSNRIRKISKSVSIEGPGKLSEPFDDQKVLNDIEEQDKINLFQKSFLKLGEKCQQVLKLFFEKKSMKEIASITGSTEGYVKKKKFECKKQLMNMVREDPLFNELKEDTTAKN